MVNTTNSNFISTTPPSGLENLSVGDLTNHEPTNGKLILLRMSSINTDVVTIKSMPLLNPSEKID